MLLKPKTILLNCAKLVPSNKPWMRRFEPPQILNTIAPLKLPTPQQKPETQPKPEGVEPGNEAEPNQQSAEGNEPIEIVVTGEREETRYSVPNATTATRTDTPIRDIPASIQVIPEQVLQDQQVTRLDEALRNVSGVIGNSSRGRLSI